MACQVKRTIGDAAAIVTPPAPARVAPGHSALLERLACPTCRPEEPLHIERGERLCCKHCGTAFAQYRIGSATLPWLFPNPDVARLEWNARLRAFRHKQVIEHNRLNRALDRTLSSPLARTRIEETMRARRAYGEQVDALLAPLGLDGEVMVPGMTQALDDNLPRNQGLDSYTNNIFRDWAWNNGENEAQFGAVAEVFGASGRDSAGTVLTLGAGACRLSYDIHRHLAPTLSVVLDINPLLLATGCRVIHGEDVSLYEFPVAARDDCISGTLQACQAPAALPAGADSSFNFLFGDAGNPPFAPRSFDTVVTPWLIDILSQDLPDFAAQLNRLLPTGGTWLNTGSLAFYHRDPRRCYGEKEVFDIVERQGFELIAVDHRTIPYLQSPHSAHGRNEVIVTFVARKVFDPPEPRPSPNMPGWLLDVTRSVPGCQEFVVESSSSLLRAQVLAAVDGKRSVQAIARMVAREYDLGMHECIHAVASILGGAVDGGNRPPAW